MRPSQRQQRLRKGAAHVVKVAVPGNRMKGTERLPLVEKAAPRVACCMQPGHTVEFLCVDADGRHELRRTLGGGDRDARLGGGALAVSVNGVVQTLTLAARPISSLKRRSTPGQRIRFWCHDSRQGKHSIAQFTPLTPKVMPSH